MNKNHYRHQRQTSQSGFTFIELILYVAIIGLIMTAAINFAFDLMTGRTKSHAQQEVSQNARLISKRIQYEIRNASAINSLSATSLCLASATAARNPTRIYLSGNALRIGWGGGGTTCATTTNDQTLTSNEIQVTGLTFQNLSSVGNTSQHVKFSFTLKTLNPGGRAEWDYQQTMTSSTELRSH